MDVFYPVFFVSKLYLILIEFVCLPCGGSFEYVTVDWGWGLLGIRFTRWMRFILFFFVSTLYLILITTVCLPCGGSYEYAAVDWGWGLLD